METGKIALVTGGSRGLGRNTALNLARKGVDVIVTYRLRADEAKAAIAEIEAAGGRAAARNMPSSCSSTWYQCQVKPTHSALRRESLNE